VTVSDKKLAVDSDNDGVVNYYNADVVTASDYYPGGMQMPGRKYSNGGSYRYGFNGQEKESELNENITSAKYWEYDSRLGRRWNVDPVLKVWESPYLCFSGNPIQLSDKDGDTAGGGPWEDFLKWLFGDDVNNIQQGSSRVRDGQASQALGPWDYKLFNELGNNPDYTPEQIIQLRKLAGKLQSVDGVSRIAFGVKGISDKSQFIVEAPIMLGSLASTLLKKPIPKNIINRSSVPSPVTQSEIKKIKDFASKLGSKMFGGKTIIVDENLSPKIASELASQGYNIKTFSKGTLDPDIIKWAKSNNAAVMTNNIKDFKGKGIMTIEVPIELTSASKVPAVVNAVNTINRNIQSHGTGVYNANSNINLVKDAGAR
jgi:predicted nuclease of predicted toxin-antitoxin system